MVLVTGGTGFVGTSVVRKLKEMGYAVRVLARNPRSKNARRLARLDGVEVVQGDILKPESLQAAMEGVDVIINLVGILFETITTTFEKAHTHGTRNLVEAAKAYGVTRFLQMSALGTRPEARSRYHKTKWEAEEIVRRSGLAHTIFRPSIIYGQGDQSISTIAGLFSSPLLADLRVLPNPGGEAKVQPVPVDEVAHCFVHAIANRGAVGQTYDIVGLEAVTWKQLVGKLAELQNIAYEHEDFPLTLILRILLWTGIIAIPVIVAILLVFGWAGGQLEGSPLTFGIFGAGWILLVGIMLAFRSWRIVTVPDLVLVALTFPTQFSPVPALRFYDQVKMLQEDNVGDAGPASEEFGYSPLGLEDGLLKFLDLKGA